MKIHSHVWLLAFILLITALIPGANSASWDNVGLFDRTDGSYGSYEIKNSLGIPLLSGMIAEYKLERNTDHCFTTCWAEGTAKLYIDSALFSDLKFVDRKNKEKSGIFYKVYIEEEYSEDVNDYEDVNCKEVENAEQERIDIICDSKIIGSHKEKRYRWIEYNWRNLKPGDYKWRIEGTKPAKESIDWRASSNGVSMKFWAWWNTDYTYKRQIIVNQTGATALSYFPYLVNGTSFNVTGVGNEGMDDQFVWAGMENLSATGTNSIHYLYYINNSYYAVINGSENAEMKYEIERGNETANNQRDLWEDAGAIAVWHMTNRSTGNIYDSVGYMNGTYTGVLPYSTGANAKFYQAIHPDGTGARVNLSKINTPAHFNMGKNFTISMWFKDTASGGALIGAGCGGDTYIYETAGKIRYAFAGTYSATTTFIPTAGQWYHLVAVHNDTHVDTYVNGILNYSQANIGSFNIQNCAIIYFGGEANDGANVYNGYIDEVRFYNQSKGPDWILREYNSGFSYLGAQTIYQLTLSDAFFGICNATVTQPALNLTIKDEATFNLINSTIDLSTLTYWFAADPATTKTHLYSSGTFNDSNFTYCISPNYTNFTSDAVLQYSSVDGATYPQRSYNYDDYIFSNATTHLIVYLLSSANGQYVTFQVINSALAPLEGTTILAQRSISGTTVNVEQKSTDASGAATLWLNPLYAHTFTFTKSGYITQVQTITPSSTTYTITMQQIGGGNATDYLTGLQHSMRPKSNVIAYNQTYNFNYTINSSDYTIQNFSMTLYNGSNYVMNSTNSTANGGSLSQILNVTNNNIITFETKWFIANNSYTINKTYYIDTVSDTGYGIKRLFSDIDTYIDSGIFGLDAFGITVIIFLIIFITSGLMCYNYGLYSPAAVAGIVFAEVALFDVGLGMIQNPFGAVTHFPSVFFGLIFAALLIKEGTSYN